MADDAATFIKALGFVAQALVAKHPGPVRKLILTGTAGGEDIGHPSRA